MTSRPCWCIRCECVMGAATAAALIKPGSTSVANANAAPAILPCARDRPDWAGFQRRGEAPQTERSGRQRSADGCYPCRISVKPRSPCQTSSLVARRLQPFAPEERPGAHDEGERLSKIPREEIPRDARGLRKCVQWRDVHCLATAEALNRCPRNRLGRGLGSAGQTQTAATSQTDLPRQRMDWQL